MAWPGIADRHKKVRNILADVKPLMLNTTKKGASSYEKVTPMHKAACGQQKVTGVNEYIARRGPRPDRTTSTGKSYRQGSEP